MIIVVVVVIIIRLTTDIVLIITIIPSNLILKVELDQTRGLPDHLVLLKLIVVIQ